MSATPCTACGASAVFIDDSGVGWCGKHWIEQDDATEGGDAQMFYADDDAPTDADPVNWNS
jgi:hypothetical protein